MKKIGITERGDASIDYAWYDKLKDVDGAVLITKSVTDEFIERVLSCDTKKLIIHATCTGYGSTVLEPRVPLCTTQLMQTRKLVDLGFPHDNIVIRVDPIIPTPKGLVAATSVMDAAYELDFRRYKISLIDMYPHVRDRFISAKLPLPYGVGGFAPTKECLDAANAALTEWTENHTDVWVDSCCEEGIDVRRVITNGCISELDLILMDIPDVKTADSYPGVQRAGCLCYKGKTELLNGKTRCPNGCLYCYWKD